MDRKGLHGRLMTNKPLSTLRSVYWKTFLGQWQLIFFCQPDTFDEPIWWKTFICKTLCWDSVFNFTFKFFFPSLPHWVFQMIFLWQEYALGCWSCLCSFKLIFGWWGLFVLKMGLVDSIHSKDGWQKLKCRSAIVSGWHVVSMYEVGYSWVLTLVVFTAFLDQDLWPQFFLRRFKFGSTSHCSFIQSGFWSVFSSALFEQLDWTSWDFEPCICSSHGASNAGPSFQCCVGPASQVLLLLYGAERACSSGGQPSLDSFLRTRKTFMSFWKHLVKNLH